MTDPALVSHLGELLQVYREAPAEKRDQALLEAMRNIKGGTAKAAVTSQAAESTPQAPPTAGAQPAPTPPVATSPAASRPSNRTFTPTWGEDRRRDARMRWFVAVELQLGAPQFESGEISSNISLGGCFVETAAPVPFGVNVEIGLWLANGKIWIKGIILTGIVTKSSPSFGVRIKFSELEPTERENLRHFLQIRRKHHQGL